MEDSYDIVGIGFGPANLALAAAIHENKSDSRALFLEKEKQFSWHSGMLLSETEMQISFLKDLATLRNPSSPFTFINYLHEKGRLSSFINLRNFYPSRIEYNQYLSWAAKKLEKLVQYNTEVIDIIPCGNKPYSLLNIISRNLLTGQTESIFSRNIVIATGGRPNIPSCVESEGDSDLVWHSSDHVKKINAFKRNANHPYHFCIVGRGQSAAEITYALLNDFPNAKITCIHRRFGFKPADESHFSNEMFDIEAVDLFYMSSYVSRSGILKDHYNTNYSVVDPELIEKIYKFRYEESVLQKNRLELLRFSNLKGLKKNNYQVELTINSTLEQDNERALSADAVIFATGYSYANPPAVLKTISPFLMLASDGKPSITRHYKLITQSEIEAGIYTLGCNENTHGLTDTLLSLNPIRAQGVLDDILFKKNDEVDVLSFELGLKKAYV